MIARVLRGVVLALTLVAAPNVAVAQGADEGYGWLSAEDRAILQYLLVWTGDYSGMVDGEVGPATRRAVRAFQERNGLRPDGILGEADLARLAEEALAASDAAGFALHDDPRTGIRLGLPMALVEPAGAARRGSRFASADGAIEVETIAKPIGEESLALLYGRLTTIRGRTVEYGVLREDWFVIAGREDGRRTYTRFQASAVELRGFSLAYPEAMHGRMARVSTAMSNAFDPFPATPAPGPAIAGRQPEVGGLDQPLPDSGGPLVSGTGFVVSGDGWIVTNAHVVEGCTTVFVGSYGLAGDIRRDTANDLALIRLRDVDALEPMPLAAGPTRLGERVLAFGFPLRDFLAESLNVTEGLVSSLAGLGGDTRYIQTSAAVQPGNSGGPLVDPDGNVVGIVTLKLDALATLRRTGDLPQSVNFAIGREALTAFLRANGIEPLAPRAPSSGLSVADIADLATKSVVPLSCRPG